MYFDSKPVKRCAKCGATYIDEDGECPYCKKRRKDTIRSICNGILIVLFIIAAGYEAKIYFNKDDVTVDVKYDMYYAQLNDTEKGIYEALELKTKNFQKRIDIPNSSEREIQRAINAFYLTNPDCYWLNHSYNYGFSSFGLLRSYYLDFNISDHDRALYEEIDVLSKEILKECENLDTYNKIKYIHDWIIENTEYNQNLSSESQDVLSVLLSRKSVCAGYSATFALLMQKCGIECYVVSGIGQSNSGADNHAWNLLHIDGHWYWVDTTWDEIIDQYDNELGIRYDYFMKDDSNFLFNHFPDSKYSYPYCEE